MSIENLSNLWPEWEVEKQLGRGSYGTVYKAVRRDNNVESYAAIKVISIPSDESELDSLRSEGLDVNGTKTYFKGIVDDFVSEIQLMESLKGIQNIVSVEDYKVLEKADGIGWDIYIRMELLTPFNSFVCDKKLSEKEVIKLGIDICTALEICDKRNIIHRDIKLENIFVNDFGYFKLGDFGVARKLENLSGGLSQKGTFNYMAPEVANSSVYDARVDIYSLGIVLYRLLNGNRLPFLNNEKQLLNPYERKNAVERRMRGEKLPAPCEATPEMADLILRACAFDPNERFENATAMKEALIELSNLKTPTVIANAAFSAASTGEHLTNIFSQKKKANDDERQDIRSSTQKKNLVLLLVVATFVAILLIAMYFVFKGPEKATDDNENWDGYQDDGSFESPPDNSQSDDMSGFLIFKTFDVNGTKVYGTVSNDTTVFSFSDEIIASENVGYTISKDAYGSEILLYDIVNLEIGDNKFYVFEAVRDNVTVYEITIRRKPIYEVVIQIDGKKAERQMVEEGNAPPKPDDPNKAGYTFLGWDYDFSEKITKDTVISAQWKINKYEIALNKTDTYAGDVSGSGTYDFGTSVTIEARTNEGFVFLGWYNGSERISSSTSYTFVVTEDKEIDAKWEKISYTLTLNCNSSNAGTVQGAGTYYYGEIVTVSVTSNMGYSFLGWYDGTDKLSANTSYSLTVMSNKVLTAKWEIESADQYTVSLDRSNTEAGTVFGGGDYEEGSIITVTATSNVGYTFIGWYDGTAKLSSNAGYTFTVTGNKTLTAKWEKNVYSVSLERNDAAAGTLSGGGNYEYGRTVTITAVSNAGYDFLGWYNGSTKLSSNESYTFKVTENKVLVGKWEKKSFVVIYDTNGGSVLEGSKNVYYGQAYGELPTPYKANYKFSGWYTEKDGGKQITANSLVSELGEHTLYARWIPNTFVVTYNANGGTLSQTEKTVTYGSSYGTLPIPAKEGYIFAGWYTAPDYGAVVEANTTVSATFDHTLYARWTLSAYSVTWTNSANTSIYVSRTSSSYPGASTGTLSSGAAVYYGDVLSITYTAQTGFSISTKGSTSITVTGNVTSSSIYATAKPNSYTANWSVSTGTSITVSRTSSPYAGASTGTLSNGATVYYGDLLSVTYAAQMGYSLSDNGKTRITVVGNVTANDIYATATLNSYTYNIVYVSSNGTTLGSETATYAYGTANTITPKTFGGYDTPTTQEVVWDSASAKTITFVYNPTAIGVQTLKKNEWWWKNKNYSNVGVKYTVSVKLSNRTADSVTAEITWTNTIIGGAWYGYGQYFNMTIGEVSTGKQTIATSSKWPSGDNYYNESATKKVTITITGLSATTTSLAYSVTPSAQNNAEHPDDFSGTIVIPAY